ncbi:hypothetical protein PMIN01_00513 [Paraphaeosphaeria minitans]|uniref:Uncharacterized protein n=1 Tax=Paraphaeosphaeria minitans TaxID=565426 RepID=A0A9P6GVJ6_9PLEO|nr:hypothetical protein PMIN01_00513 [Paraphaeosphaeria minitans]
MLFFANTFTRPDQPRVFSTSLVIPVGRWHALRFGCNKVARPSRAHSSQSRFNISIAPPPLPSFSPRTHIDSPAVPPSTALAPPAADAQSIPLGLELELTVQHLFSQRLALQAASRKFDRGAACGGSVRWGRRRKQLVGRQALWEYSNSDAAQIDLGSGAPNSHDSPPRPDPVRAKIPPDEGNMISLGFAMVNAAVLVQVRRTQLWLSKLPSPPVQPAPHLAFPTPTTHLFKL